MRFKFLLAAVAALFALPCFNASAQIVLIDLNTSGDEVTGDLIAADEDDINSGAISLPAAFTVAEAAGTDAEGLQFIINGFTASDSPEINASNNNFGVNSGGAGDSATRFDADLGETVTVSFDRDVYLQILDFNGLSAAGEQFRVNDIVIGQSGDTDPAVDLFHDAVAGINGTDFTDDGATLGLFVAAGDTLTFEALGPAESEVGIRDLTVFVPPSVPEPSSLAILGLLGVAAIRRRR